MLEVAGLVVRYDRVPALDGVDLRVGDGEVVCVLGPSGGGKSTLLRTVAGLEAPAEGAIAWDGRDLRDVPPHLRRFGLMFQDHALFPHRDVAGNVGFGLRMQGIDAPTIRARTDELLTLVGLPGFADRPVRSLSGGEQQRVALARALAPNPRLLMLDEPLGALDRALRERLVDELRAIFLRRERAVLLVTHDHEEAFALADRVVVLRDGRVEQDADAATVWARPATAFVAGFLGYNVTTAFGSQIAVRPEGLTLTPDGSAPTDAPAGAVAVTVVDRTFRRDHFRVRVRTAAGEVLDVAFREPDLPAAGTPGHLALDPAAAVPLPA
ncbi:MAG: ABC transporter ATP-binding protein [Actinobacteria bacterium]|nr:ABC transporter ATP-binding protein [Actinomycetota bacterium]